MEAELQTEEPGTTEVDETGSGAESAPAEEPKAPEGFIKAEDAQKDINKQHRKYRDEERARKKIEAEAESLRKENEELKASKVDTTIPPVPDPYSDNYQEETRLRDEAIQRKTEYETQQASIAADQKRNEEAEALRESEELAAKAAAFNSNMITLGLNSDEVTKAAGQLLDYGISDSIRNAIVADEEGPLMVQYLANNPLEYEKLAGMSVLKQGEFLNGDIRQKASLLRPQTSKAPDPPETLTGGGVAELTEDWEKGVTYS